MNEDYLEHHGVLGMKWGVRRYQNEDGSYTPEGRRHSAAIKGTNSSKPKVKGLEISTHKMPNAESSGGGGGAPTYSESPEFYENVTDEIYEYYSDNMSGKPYSIDQILDAAGYDPEKFTDAEKSHLGQLFNERMKSHNSMNHSDEDEYLMHYGVLGMKWGVRRYQNEDGSLKPAGRKHYGIGKAREKASNFYNENKGTIKKAGKNAARKVGTAAVIGGIAGGAFASAYGSSQKSKAKTDPNNYSEEDMKRIREYNKKAAVIDQYNKRHKEPSKAETARNAFNSAGNAIESAKNMSDRIARQNTPREDLSKYSDEELRKIVNRQNLENQYRNLNPVQLSEGQQKFDEIMDYAKDITIVGANIASLVVGIIALKNAKGG